VDTIKLIDINSIKFIVASLLIGSGFLLTQACYGSYCGITKKIPVRNLVTIFFVLAILFLILSILKI